MDETTLQKYFSKLGLSNEVASIYWSLFTRGPQTLSELSRSSHVERTRIYRLLDTLKSSNLIEVETHYKRGVLKAAPISNIHILIGQKEQELKDMQDSFSVIEQRLRQDSLSNPTTRVQFYKGAEGFKQMFWNETRANTEVLCIVYQIAQPNTNIKFFERWVDRNNENGVHYREIHGDQFRKSKVDWYATNTNRQLRYYEERYISSNVFTITHSIDVYDDVVAYYNWKDGEIFGIEICNQDIANGQRQFFELLWPMAEPEFWGAKNTNE